MEWFSLLWLFFIISSLQPLLKKKMLESTRKKMIRQLEKKTKSRVIVLIHRQEIMSLLGFPVYRYIDVNDSEEVIRAIHLTASDVPIELIIHTPGGLVLAALQIAKAIKKHPAKVTAYIPHIAMSGGTLIALAADEIVLDEHAVLGPVDPQLQGFPAASLIKVLQIKPMSEVSDQTIILADIAQKAMEQIKTALFQLLRDRLGEIKAKEIAELLVEGYWTHDHPLTYEEIKAMGLAVRSNIPVEIYNLMNLFPQPIRRQPSVEYLPEKRRRDDG